MPGTAQMTLDSELIRRPEGVMATTVRILGRVAGAILWPVGWSVGFCIGFATGLLRHSELTPRTHG